MDIIDALLAADTANQRRNDIRELKLKIATVECGDCSKWMIDRLCPREARGVCVTCRDPVCSEFMESRMATDRRQRWKSECNNLARKS